MPFRFRANKEKSGAHAGARKLYKRFYQFEPRKEVAYDLAIPERVFYVGEAKQVLYRSDKLNPETSEDEGIIDYYHDHEGRVRFHLADLTADHDAEIHEVVVPARIRNIKAVTVLGKCLGFTFKDFDGKNVSAKGTDPLPELVACPPNGKALMIVQNKRTVIAIIWGGTLAVHPEGIVG